MLERAARARAGASGTSAEAIVAGWAGAPIPEAGAASVATAPAAAPSAAAPVEEAVSGLSVEVLEPAAETEESEQEPEPEPEPELVGPGLPRWLSAAFVIVPFIAILYALSVPNGPDCGNAGRLGLDEVTGVAVNCDGSEFGSEEVDVFALGQSVYDSTCAACHGPTGGGGAGPALAGGSVVSTFASCTDHIEWVTLGSDGWPDGTYGDNATTVAGGMPGFGALLDASDLVAAVFYERVAFGAEELTAAEASCGLAPAAEALAAP